ncbi:hypothetical protein ACTU6U_11305 [Microbacterium sp. A196]
MPAPACDRRGSSEQAEPARFTRRTSADAGFVLLLLALSSRIRKDS